MEEENKNVNSDGGTMPEEGMLAGKFKSVDALVRAYGELESEFTRRSQRRKALEEKLAFEEPSSKEEPHAPHGQEELLRAVTEDEGLRLKLFGDYLQSLRGVPLMGAGGMGVVAPVKKPATIAEAGALALGYFKRQK